MQKERKKRKITKSILCSFLRWQTFIKKDTENDHDQ